MSTLHQALSLSGLEVLNCLDGVAYATDLNGVITYIGVDNWERFASLNEAFDVSPNAFIGRSLFDIVAGGDVVEAYRALHRDVISGERAAAAFTYRCDAPTVERLMRMSIGPLMARGRVVGVLYQSQLLEEHIRPAPHLWLQMGDKNDPASPLAPYCSSCVRIALPRRSKRRTRPVWISIEEYVAEGGPWPATPLHTICADCRAQMQS